MKRVNWHIPEAADVNVWPNVSSTWDELRSQVRGAEPCGDAFPIERVLVATYLLSVEVLPHCRCGVANKSCMV